MMPKDLILLLLALVNVPSESSVAEKYVECPLVWTPSAFGEPLPPTSLPSSQYEVRHYISRTVGPDGSYTAGRMDGGWAFSVLEEQARNVSSFEILSNPHGCLIGWLAFGGGQPDPRAVPVQDGSSKFVGRGKVGDSLLSGEIGPDGGISIVNLDGTSVSRPPTFELLIAYSKGLSLHMTKFTFDDDVFDAGIDFLGIDEIRNRGDAHVTQTVDLRKRILQSTTVRNRRTSSQTFNVKLSIQAEIGMAGTGGAGTLPLPSPAIEFEYELGHSSETQEEFTYEFETVTEIRREVRVPPHTQVQVCASVAMAENFELTYLATGRYSGPGLTSEQVGELLEADGIVNGLYDGEGGVLVEESGTFQGTLAMTTRFITVPVDAPIGCSDLASLIRNYRRAKKSGALTKSALRQKYNQIEESIQNMTKQAEIRQSY